MGKTILTMSIAICLITTAVPMSALAQFDIKSILKTGPVKFSAGLSGVVSLSQDQQTALVNITTSAVLRDVQPIINASIPQLNETLACGKGRPYGAIVHSASLFDQNNTLQLKAQASGVTCSSVSVSANFNITIPINVQIVNNSVHLQAAPAAIEPVGFFGVVAGIGGGVQEAERQLNPRIGRFAQQFNSLVDKQLAGQALQGQIKTYKLKINSVGVYVQNGDLTLTLAISGQVPLSTLSSKELLF